MSITSEIRKNVAGTRSQNNRQIVLRSHRSLENFKMCISVVVVWLFTAANALDEVDTRTDLERVTTCSKASDDTITLQIDVGWPFQIDCEQQYEKFFDYTYYADEQELKINETTYECITVSEDKVLSKEVVSEIGNYVYSIYEAYSEPYVIPAVSEKLNGTSYSSYLIGGDTCFKITYNLIVQRSGKEQSCADVTDADTVILERKLTQNKVYELLCVANGSNFNLMPETYNITWYKNCVEIKNTIGTAQLGYHGDKPAEVGSLAIQKANFDTTPGEYSCSVTYNGKTRFLNKNKVCVKYDQIGGPPNYSQLTSSSVKAQEGKDVTLTCGGYPGGSFAEVSFLVLWYKNDTNGTYDGVCVAHQRHLKGVNEDDEKYECDLLSNVDETSTCYTNPVEAAKDELQGLVNINSTLIIRNFRNSDSGRYVCKILSTRGPVEVSFDVQRQRTSILVIALPIIAGVFFLLMVSILLCVCFKRRIFKKQQKMEKDSIDQSECKGVNNNSYTAEYHKNSLPLDV